MKRRSKRLLAIESPIANANTMLRLLEPWAGHRQRVIRLIEITQAARAPRFGPRSPRARPLR